MKINTLHAIDDFANQLGEVIANIPSNIRIDILLTNEEFIKILKQFTPVINDSIRKDIKYITKNGIIFNIKNGFN